MLYLNVEESASWLADGKILIHPTEGVWGIGCDAKNKKAVDRVFDLKKRDPSVYIHHARSSSLARRSERRAELAIKNVYCLILLSMHT